MLGSLHQDDHFPCRSKYRVITLLLPKFNIELPVSRLAAHHPGLEFSLCRLAVFSFLGHQKTPFRRSGVAAIFVDTPAWTLRDTRLVSDLLPMASASIEVTN